jgi:ABC-2 type transport system permease protein
MENWKRNWRLIRLFWKTSVQQETAFRGEVAAKLVDTLIGLAGSLGALWILFSARQTFNGWGLYETLTVTGMFLSLQGLRALFLTPSLAMLAGMDGELWDGRFDYTLLKPVPVRFHVSLRRWSPLALLDVALGVGVLVFALSRLGEAWQWERVLVFLGLLASGLVLMYALMLILASFAFWYLGTPLLWILDSVMELGRYPVRLYPPVFRHALTWGLPVGLMISLPVEALLGRAPGWELALAPVVAVLFSIVGVVVFRESLKRYASASS